MTIRDDIKHKIPPGLSRAQRRRVENMEALKLLYLRALPRVFTVTMALKAAGASSTQLWQWREHDLEFSLAEKQCRDQIADMLEAEAIRRAVKGVKTPVYQGGLLAGHVQEYSDSLLVVLLKGMRPERYRERTDVTVTPIVKVVAGLDPADVL